MCSGMRNALSVLAANGAQDLPGPVGLHSAKRSRELINLHWICHVGLFAEAGVTVKPARIVSEELLHCRGVVHVGIMPESDVNLADGLQF